MTRLNVSAIMKIGDLVEGNLRLSAISRAIEPSVSIPIIVVEGSLGSAAKSIFAASASDSNSSTTGSPSFSISAASAAISRMAWFEGTSWLA